MPGETTAPAPQGATPSAPSERVVSPEDKKLAADWLKKIEKAKERVPAERFAKYRKLLRGKAKENDEASVRANLHFANMAAMLPAIYAKDPEFAVDPTKAAGPQQAAAKLFAETAEIMLHRVVVKDAKLKKAAKKSIRSGFATAIGWLKASYQENPKTDVLIANRIKDTQDNLQRIEAQIRALDDPKAGTDQELKRAQLRAALDGLQQQAELKVARGIALDFCLSEDVFVVDPSILSITDYTRAAAMVHRVWMTPDKFEATYGYRPKGGKLYTNKDGKVDAAGGSTDQGTTLMQVYELWDQDNNQILTLTDGDEGFCKPPFTPDWTGKRWYGFFLIAFNEIDGTFYPLSDIELTEKLVNEYNESREDFVRDRRECLPINIARKGGSLSDQDLERVKNRQGGDLILVEGSAGNPISNDIWSGQLGKIDPANYDTGQTRYDMERVLGGSDTTTGSITKAKTLGEAELLTAAVRSRSSERQDTLEDMLNELGPYCLEIMLRKWTPAEVEAIAGQGAAWPQLSIDQIFNLVTVEVRGGSTGKPDIAQEQERWTKLLPIINEAVAKISELREKGQDALADAVIKLTRETLRRFDERIDIEEFLPKKPQGEDDPVALKQQLVQAKGQIEAITGQLKDVTAKVERGYVSAAASIATSADPRTAAMAFLAALGVINPALVPPTVQQPPIPDEPDVPGQPEELDPPGTHPVLQPQTAPMPQ